MSVQTTYLSEHAEGYAGMIADGQLRNTISKLNGTGSTIEYGKGVFTDGETGMTTTGAATAFIGFLVRELNRAYAPSDTFGCPDKRDGSVMTEGVMWVKAAVTVAKDDPVYVRTGATATGDVSNVVGTGATLGVLVANAKVLTGGDVGELVKISLGLGG